MEVRTKEFKARSAAALGDAGLQAALGNIRTGWVLSRARAAERLPEFEALRDRSKAIKDHALAHLDIYLERFTTAFEAAGGKVHFARDAAEARRLVLAIAEAEGARRVTKSKSMVTEEIGLNPYLEAAGLEVVETDLGEYIIQLRKEPPSHLVGPAVHLTKDAVAELFEKVHGGPRLEEGAALVAQARQVLRQRYLDSDIGITGANFLVAETGSIVTVTNEGNAELTQGLPRVHVCVTGIEKVVPTLGDAFTLLRVLARSATGQDFSAYTTVMTGPRRAADLDGPQAFHIVLVDAGRSAMLGSDKREMLRCIRCGACMNHCPVYLAAGGHAYGWVYVGPMGAVLTPQLVGIDKGHPLPNASTFCGKCEEVCPVRIPLPKLMRSWRETQHEQRLDPPTVRFALSAWAFVASRPRLYRLGARIAAVALKRLGGGRGRLAKAPLAGGWTGTRDLPAPEGATFMAAWKAGGGKLDRRRAPTGPQR